MLVNAIRAVIIYSLLIMGFRLMGKRQIGEFQPFEFIITLMIAELASVPMTDISIPIFTAGAYVCDFVMHTPLRLSATNGGALKNGQRVAAED